jgi:hypothetical protein
VELEVTIRPTSSAPQVAISGKVVTANTVTTPGTIRIAPFPQFGQTFETSVGTDGSFQFTKVLPGTYRVQWPGYSQAMGLVGVGGAPNGRPTSPGGLIELVVADKDITGLELRPPGN